MTKLKNLSKELGNALNMVLEELTRPSTMQKLGNELKDDVVKRTRLGFGADKDGGQRQKFIPLSDSYKEQRKGKLAFWTNDSGKIVPVSLDRSKVSKEQYRKNKSYIDSVKPDLSSNTRASKSNLTQTGDMLDKMGVTSGKGRFTIGFKTSKAARKASFVSRKRPFMFATRQQINRLTTSVRKMATSILNRKINF